MNPIPPPSPTAAARRGMLKLASLGAQVLRADWSIFSMRF